MGKPLDAKITLYVSDTARTAFQKIEHQHFTAMFITSEVEVIYGPGEGYAGVEFPGVTVKVETSTLPKCPRCWTHSATVGESHEHPELCARCAAALAE